MTAADVLVESLMDWGVLTGLILPDLPVELSPEDYVLLSHWARELEE